MPFGVVGDSFTHNLRQDIFQCSKAFAPVYKCLLQKCKKPPQIAKASCNITKPNCMLTLSFHHNANRSSRFL